MGFNFGGFAGGLVHGYERGLAIGEKVDKLNQRNKVRELIQEGLAQKEAADATQKANGRSSVVEAPAVAGQAYQSDSGAVVTPIPTPGAVEAQPLAQPQDDGSVMTERSAPIPGVSEAPPAVSTQLPSQQITQPTAATTAAGGLQSAKYMNGDTAFDTRAAAEESATGKIQSKDEYLVKSIYPKVRDYYMSQGDLEGAKHWDEYSKSKRGEAVNTAWAKMVTAPDLETMTKYGRDLYEYVDDGITTTGQKILTKSDGTQVAVVTLKDKKTGKESEMELTRERLMQLGGMANPQKMYDDYKTMEKETRLAKFKIAQTAAHDEAILNRQAQTQAAITERAAELEKARAQSAKDLAQFKHDLTEGESARYKKTTDPAERASILRQNIDKNDKYAKLDDAAKNKLIQGWIEADDNIGDAVKNKRAGKGDAPPSKPSSEPKYFTDTKTGRPVMLKDGKIVPLEPNKAAPPAMPAVQSSKPQAPVAAAQAPLAQAEPSRANIAAGGLSRDAFKAFMDEKNRSAQGQ